MKAKNTLNCFLHFLEKKKTIAMESIQREFVVLALRDALIILGILRLFKALKCFMVLHTFLSTYFWPSDDLLRLGLRKLAVKQMFKQRDLEV